MNKDIAKELVKDTLQNSFNKERFVYFIKNLLNRIDSSKAFHVRGYVQEKYKPHVKTYERIGTYTDIDKDKIDVLIVYLQKENSIERARTTLRNFIADYLKERGEKEAGLVAFVSPNRDDWRFSFVKMEYKLGKTPKGRIKAKEEFTSARRFSYLVGRYENSHTAQSRFAPILEEDTYNPTFKQLEDAFSIEKVTKEFFGKYRELFLKIKDALDEIVKKNTAVKTNFIQKGVNTVDFSKKLLGQIVFLYFLQKKGWFGVERRKEWGSGSKHFLRELFEKKHSNYKNFFNDILEPLFYEALREDRSHNDDYFSQFKCRIPFLNGGLFDPLNDYAWVNTDILLPDELFSNVTKTKEGDIGTGVLDVFDRYNFTVKEDEPLEKEVAVDPEMLGKVYEKFNAIRPDNYEEYKKALKSGQKGTEGKFNKQYGVYYTPREIVHYMCQQSLINYLIIELDGKVCKGDIETLIKYGEQVGENEATVEAKGRETDTYFYKLSESIRQNAKVIDEQLANIKVCDPAIGSGAFPVGMMGEIIKARNVLSTYLKTPGRAIYNFKRECIEKSLYGVDIDPGAVEIAKLRLWLSLIVDEEDIKQIGPLPNLDYKIMQGNSLISEFMGINLDDEQKKDENLLLFTDEVEELSQQLNLKKDKFLNEPIKMEKERLRDQIENLIVKMFELKLKNQKADYFSKLRSIEKAALRLPKKEAQEEYRNSEKQKLYKNSRFNLEEIEEQLRQYTGNRQIRPFFPWKLYFSEVFHAKKGFDILIANPPYDVYEGHKKNEIEELNKISIYNKAKGRKLNAYKLFLAKSIELQKPDGILCEIFQNSFLADNSAKLIRRYFLENQKVLQIDSFPERDDVHRRVFENAKMSVCVLISVNTKLDFYNFILGIWIDRHMTSSKKVIFDNQGVLNFDIENTAIPSISQDEVVILEKVLGQPRLKEIALCYEGEINLTFHKKFIKKEKRGNAVMIKGAAIQKWYLTQKMSQGEIEYLDKESYFSENKGKKSMHHKFKRIVMQGITGVDEKFRLKMTIINPNIFCGNSANYILILDNKVTFEYLLALLNSTLLNWYFKIFSTNSNVNGYEVNNFPIPNISNSEEKPFVNLVNNILAITADNDHSESQRKQARVHEYERQIDQMVYKLYGLTDKEIKIVGVKNE